MQVTKTKCRIESLFRLVFAKTHTKTNYQMKRELFFKKTHTQNLPTKDFKGIIFSVQIVADFNWEKAHKQELAKNLPKGIINYFVFSRR